jgi:nucleotide-binding universal stress UspA family protein
VNQGAIAVSVDGSPASTAALEYAAALARAQHRPLAGIFVLDTGWVDYIGADWVSARGARRGFLEYVRGQLESHAEAARSRSYQVVSDLDAARFSVVPGDRLDRLCAMMARGEAEVLVAGLDVFQVLGRPNVKRLMKDLQRRVGRAMVIVWHDGATDAAWVPTSPCPGTGPAPDTALGCRQIRTPSFDDDQRNRMRPVGG